jgi:hypothetical protein
MKIASSIYDIPDQYSGKVTEIISSARSSSFMDFNTFEKHSLVYRDVDFTGYRTILELPSLKDFPGRIYLDFTPRKPRFYISSIYSKYGRVVTSFRRVKAFRLKRRSLFIPKSSNAYQRPRFSRPRLAKSQISPIMKSSLVSPVNSYSHFTQQFINNGSFHHANEYDYITYHRDWLSGQTPNFKSIHKRSLHPLDYSLYMYRILDGGYFYQQTFLPSPNILSEVEIGPYIIKLGGDAYGPTLPSCQHLDVENLKNKALSRLIDMSKVQMTNLSQDLATWNQTSRMISGNLNKIVSSVNSLRRGNISAATSVLFSAGVTKFRPRGGPSKSKNLASNWLEF